MTGPVIRRAAADRWLDRAHERFAAEGLRIGAARARALDVIARDATCLVSVLDLVSAVRNQGGAGSQASVYRVVEQAHRLGLLRRELGADGWSGTRLCSRICTITIWWMTPPARRFLSWMTILSGLSRRPPGALGCT